MIPVFLLLLLLTSNSLALDEEQRQFIISTIQELSRKASNGEQIPADNPLSVFLLNIKTEADDGAERFPGHPVIHFLSNGEVKVNNMETALLSTTGEISETTFAGLFNEEFINSVENLLTKKEEMMRQVKKAQSEATSSGRESLTETIANREFTFLADGSILLADEANAGQMINLGNKLDSQTFDEIFPQEVVASYEPPKKKVMLVQVDQGPRTRTQANTITSNADSLSYSLALFLLPLLVSKNL